MTHACCLLMWVGEGTVPYTLYLHCGSGEIFTEAGFLSSHWHGGPYCALDIVSTNGELVVVSADQTQCGDPEVVTCGRAYPGTAIVDSCPAPAGAFKEIAMGSHCDCPDTAAAIIAQIKKTGRVTNINVEVCTSAP